MDTTYVTIMLVVFLVVTGLAIDIGYMYVSEEDLQSAAETAALAGTQAIKQRMLFQVQTNPKEIAPPQTTRYRGPPEPPRLMSSRESRARPHW
jgi:hypothetical protein